jgi:ABC-type nitrate/sulfonate/bicarbonate transport system permease component
MNAIDLRNIPTIMSLILTLAVFAVLSNSVILAVDRRLHRRQ